MAPHRKRYRSALHLLLACAVATATGWTITLQAQTSAQYGEAIIGTLDTDYANGVAVSASGEIFVTGYVGYGEEPFPFTAGAYQAPGPGYASAYVLKLAPSGALLFAARLGDYGVQPQSVALDPSGNVVVAGLTSVPFPVTEGAVNAGTAQGTRAFVMKLSADGSTVLYSALLGPVALTSGDVGSGGMVWQIAGPSLRVKVDGDGNAYLSGTALPGFPTTAGAYGTALKGASDAFVAKLSADGKTLLYSTLVGGSGADEGHGLAIDATGAAIAAGTTATADFPATTVLHDGQESHAFVVRLSSDGSTLEASSRISGELGAHARDVALGPTGDIYLTGITTSPDFPVYPATAGRFDHPWQVRRAETFVVRLTPDAAGIVYSTSLLNAQGVGGFGDDGDAYQEPGSAMAIAIEVDTAGRAIVAGLTTGAYNVYAQIPVAFSAQLAADGSLLSTGGYSSGQWGGAIYDVALNQFGDRAFAINTNNWADVAGVEPTFGKDPFHPYWVHDAEEGLPGWMSTDGKAVWSIAPRPPAGNTPAGGAAIITAAANDASVSFAAVTSAGNTTLTPVDAGSLNLALPGGFAISGSSQAYEIRTTATVSGIQVCLSGAGLADGDFASAVILHGVAGAWQVETTTRDAATRQLCATVTSLSPFAVGVRLDTAAPVITCASAPAGWSNDNVTIACTAADAGAGLASAADAAFTLATNVAAGTETAVAVTNAREICDTAGNCATAGPVGGIRIDRKAPTAQVTSPANRRYLLNEVAAAAYVCADGGQLTACAGTVANDSPIDTATAGAKTFALQATDAAGHTATASVSYTVGYAIQVPFDQTLTVKRGKTLPLGIRLADAAGVNVSAPATVVTVRELRMMSNGSSIPIQDSAWLNPDHTFFFSSGLYVYALGTKKLEPGRYELRFTAGMDPTLHALQLTITK
jgi:hypothetical protein